MGSNMFDKPAHRCFWTTVLLIGLAVLTILPAPTRAQDVATGQALATVQDALTVSADQNLQFGLVFQGVAKTVPNTDPVNAGIFTITGLAGAEISIFLILPEYLATDALSGGGDDRMTVSFDATDATIAYEAASTPDNLNPGGSVPDVGENPHNLGTYLLGTPNPDNVAKLFLGGKVTPSVNQKPGGYEGDITCTVAYTGS